MQRLEVPAKQKILFRTLAVLIAFISLFSGIPCFIVLENIFVLPCIALLLFISYNMWLKTYWILEIKPGGILLSCRNKKFYIPWNILGEFAESNSVNAVEFTFKGEDSLNSYKGLAYLKYRTPRFLPHTFGMKAKDLAKLLNEQKRKYDPQFEFV